MILAVVMVAIGTSRVTSTKMLGLGIALAVLMDAMVVRGLLVPAVMKLMGRSTWWAPAPLRAFHRRFGLSEGESAPAAAASAPAPAPAPDGAAVPAGTSAAASVAAQSADAAGGVEAGPETAADTDLAKSARR